MARPEGSPGEAGLNPATAGLRLRPWRKRDIPAIAGIEQQAYPYPWPEGILQDCYKAGHHGWVATGQGGEVVAYAIVQPVLDEAHLLNLCTAPDWQGQGVGRAMLEGVMATCRMLGMRRMLLEVRASNAAARALYLSSGFSEDGLRKGYYPAGAGREDAILMSRMLPE